MSFYAIRRNSSWLCHHGVKGQKWGVKNGPPYPIDSDKIASGIYAAASKQEPKITKDLKELVSTTDGKLYGLEHKLKTKDSIHRKIETDASEKGLTEFVAASDIKDAVRYTLLSNDDSFVNNYDTIKSGLVRKGYSEVRCKNYFDLYRQGKVKHKSVQSVFSTPDGYRFEIQFQTPSSQNAKDAKLPLYEEHRSLKTTAERRKELESQMERLAEKVSTPRNIYSIKTH